MPVWLKWVGLIATGFLSGAGSTAVDGSHTGGLGALIRGGIGAALAALGGWTDTTKSGGSGGSSTPTGAGKMGGD